MTVAEATRWVVISYSPKRSEVGKCVELPMEEAKQKVAEGRARYATDEEKGGAGATAEPDAGTAEASSAGRRPR